MIDNNHNMNKMMNIQELIFIKKIKVKINNKIINKIINIEIIGNRTNNVNIE